MTARVDRRVVYLDLNYWIGLAQADVGKREGERYRALLLTLRQQVAAGAIQVPLSLVHYLEMSRIKSPQRRRALATVMVEISRHQTLLAREALLRHELRLALAEEFGIEYTNPGPERIGFGIGYATAGVAIAGRFAGLSPADHNRFISGQGPTVLSKAADSLRYPFPDQLDASDIDAFYRSMASVVEFFLLKGPEDTDLPALVEYGYDPEAAHVVTQHMRDREQSLAEHLVAEPASPGHLEDIVNARAFYWDLSDELPAALSELGIEGEQIFEEGKSRLVRIIARIPILVVESAIRYGMFRMGTHVWETNDIYDLGHMGLAVPHCDVVAGDRNTIAQLRKAAIDRQLPVKLASTPEGVLALLAPVERSYRPDRRCLSRPTWRPLPRT